VSLVTQNTYKHGGDVDVEQLLSKMTLDEKIGQMFLLAFSADRLDEARILFEEHFVGASYIGNDNVPTRQKAVELTAELQRYAANTRLQIPLILGADQEGAWGVMVPDSCTGPGNMALGATARPDDAFEMYRVIGQELKSVGLNTVLGPCADCNSNPYNSIIGMRSFGEKPSLVGALTAAAVKGAHMGGVIATVKHFPGHGDTTLDTHRGLASVKRTQEELLAIDLYPFAEGIKAGADIVMTAHIIFSALDPHNPATLSRTILQDVLREDMGFGGVILSDSMNMHAMRKNFSPEDAAIRAFQAGVDLLMLAEEHYDHDAQTYLRQQIGLIQAVKAAVEQGDLLIDQVDAAVRRVLSLKQKAALFSEEPAASSQSAEAVGSAPHRAIELEVSRHAIMVMKDAHKHVPISATKPIVLVNTTARNSYSVLNTTRGIGPNQTKAAFDYFAEAMHDKYPQLLEVAAEDMSGDMPAAIFDTDALIVAVTENYPLPGMDFDQTLQRMLIKQLIARVGERLIVVGLRDPYELKDFPDVPTYVCAFSFRPCAAQAAADVLAGAVPAVGLTPVSIPNTDYRANDNCL
jgi:beta-N-acetylhexosaminidase